VFHTHTDQLLKL